MCVFTFVAIPLYTASIMACVWHVSGDKPEDDVVAGELESSKPDNEGKLDEFTLPEIGIDAAAAILSVMRINNNGKRLRLITCRWRGGCAPAGGQYSSCDSCGLLSVVHGLCNSRLPQYC